MGIFCLTRWKGRDASVFFTHCQGISGEKRVAAEDFSLKTGAFPKKPDYKNLKCRARGAPAAQNIISYWGHGD